MVNFEVFGNRIKHSVSSVLNSFSNSFGKTITNSWRNSKQKFAKFHEYYKTSFVAVISFVFSSRIINDFELGALKF